MGWKLRHCRRSKGRGMKSSEVRHSARKCATQGRTSTGMACGMTAVKEHRVQKSYRVKCESGESGEDEEVLALPLAWEKRAPPSVASTAWPACAAWAAGSEWCHGARRRCGTRLACLKLDKKKKKKKNKGA